MMLAQSRSVLRLTVRGLCSALSLAVYFAAPTPQLVAAHVPRFLTSSLQRSTKVAAAENSYPSVEDQAWLFFDRCACCIAPARLRGAPMSSHGPDPLAGVFRYYQVSVSAKELPGYGKLDPLAVVYTGSAGQYAELGRTRVLKNQWNPRFPEVFYFPCDTSAQEAAHIRVDFYNKDVRQDRFLGTASCQLVHIVQNGTGELHIPFTTPETGAVHPKARVILSAAMSYNKPGADSSSCVRFALELEQTNFYNVSMKAFYEIARAGSEGSASWTTVVTSPNHYIDAQGWCQFPPVETDVRQLALDNPDTPLLVTLYRHKSLGRNRRMLGHFQTSLSSLSRMTPGTMIPFTGNSREDLLAANVRVEAVSVKGTMYNIALKLVNVRWRAEEIQPPEGQ